MGGFTVPFVRYPCTAIAVLERGSTDCWQAERYLPLARRLGACAALEKQTGLARGEEGCTKLGSSSSLALHPRKVKQTNPLEFRASRDTPARKDASTPGSHSSHEHSLSPPRRGLVSSASALRHPPPFSTPPPPSRAAILFAVAYATSGIALSLHAEVPPRSSRAKAQQPRPQNKALHPSTHWPLVPRRPPPSPSLPSLAASTMSPPLAVFRDDLRPCCASAAPPPASSAKGDASESRDSLGRHSLCLECTICLETPACPVVTFCGHLFCYCCLAEWLKVHSTKRQCPVCKAGVSQVVRILGQGMPMDVLHLEGS